MARASIEDIKGQAARISELTGEKYQIDQDNGATNGWRLMTRRGNDWVTVVQRDTVTQLNTYLMEFIHGAEIMLLRQRK